ncbi:alpha-(1,3)-fucosyltransferase C-like isoform X1 [Artemia franciscana]|uniref:alpha-(1,3)-fucosyltransferase C-like isoform X1 n=1 Tax=Artemia franciscana TaxID=6661 RepID=UPI0032DA230B
MMTLDVILFSFQILQTMYAKFIFVWILGFATLMIVLTSYLASIHDDNFEQNVSRLQLTNSTKVILLWNPFFESLDYGFGFGDVPFRQNKCEYTNCYITNNTSYRSPFEFDAIVFHAPRLKLFPAMSTRTYRQRYVFFSMESPENFKTNQFFDNFFNWTITYRNDSDIYSPFYGEIKRREKIIELEHKKFTKKKGVAWMVSNCVTPSGREDYVQELRRHIPVDVYGKCGTNNCPKQHKKKCYEMIERDYKFYLSFENSLCKDYVTEKLFNILQYDIIPVVYGAAEYERILPPNSYINALDYDPYELANLLRDIGDDPNKYRKYLKWKEEYGVNLKIKHAFCELCKKLHTDIQIKFYRDFNKWWIDGSKCTQGPI